MDNGGPSGRPFTFDPFGWAERFIPARALHRLVRVAMALVCLGFLARRVAQYEHFAWKLLWAAETGVFVVLVLAYLIRVEPVDRARGVREILVPLLGAVLPFALLFDPVHPAVAGQGWSRSAVFAAMTAGTGLTVWGMWALRGAFSITVEARKLVTTGPYRWVRHPVYLGEMVTTAAVAAWRFSWINAALLTLFVTVQLVRSRWEERKLAAHFEAYDRLRRESRWFW